MYKDELNNLLDTIYELEGLVHLAITRDDSPAKLPELIAHKGEEISRLTKNLGKNEPEPEPIPEPEPVLIPEPEPILEPAPIPMPEPSFVAEENRSPVSEPETLSILHSPEPRGKLVFSLNDRYRFKRELFGGSDTAFNATLSLVASLDSYDEAEEYFLEEKQWDPARPEVTEFLEILKKYYH